MVSFSPGDSTGPGVGGGGVDWGGSEALSSSSPQGESSVSSGVILSRLVGVGVVFATSSSRGIPVRLCPTISEVPMSDRSATAALRLNE